jgi:hypothetical protein
MAAMTPRRLSSTALAAAFVLALVVAASSAARTVGAGRPAAHLHAAMRATSAPVATKQQPDQTAATLDKAGSSGCSSNPNNGGGRCPGSSASHRQISSGNSNQTTD